MTLFETATELHVRLEAASAADAGDELLSRGRTVRDDVRTAAEHLEAVQTYRAAMGRTDAPSIDAKDVRQAVGRFRGALSKSGPKALQQQSAATLLEVLVAQTRRADRWVSSAWKENFIAAEELGSRSQSGVLHGSPADRTKARSRGLTLEAARKMDPVKDRATLEKLLKVHGLDSCLARVGELIGELREAIAAIDQEQSAMPTAVRAVLVRAASGDGLPLGEVTAELLMALQSAGVLDDLVVRRS